MRESEMVMIDWGSDVCSSDLAGRGRRPPAPHGPRRDAGNRMATGRLRRLRPANARFARRRVGRPDREPTPAARARLAARYPACMPAPASDNVLSPSHLNALARSPLDDAFPPVLVAGETGNPGRPAPGGRK